MATKQEGTYNETTEKSMRTDAITRDFETWWRNEGSGIGPHKNDDMESHAKRIARIAWMNGAYKEEENQAAYAKRKEGGR